MNDRAAALGMGRTRVANPCGLDAAGQHSTPADLWRLSDAVMAQPALAATVSRPRGALQTAGGRTIRFQTSNQLLGRVEGVVGVKTGQTALAGRNLIALARRGDGEVLVVLMGAKDRWEIATTLIEQAFARVRLFGPAAAASAAPAASGLR
jgi:D-alanyl-D-alanine carboxypeptidase (penicillin-binding protein 5/6)